MRFELTALTPIWTGGIGRNDGTSATRLTGIKGSIRWWFEALVRGLGGYACDPTSENRCQLEVKKLDPNTDLLSQLDRWLCPACQLFGCTGWSGKFILRTEKIVSGKTELYPNVIGPNDDFAMTLVPLKTLKKNEIAFLNSTIRLIVEHGAIGGKLTLKPSEHTHKNLPTHWKRNHLDYGIITYRKGFEIARNALPELASESKSNIRDWPNLKYFWFVTGAWINRNEHNSLVKRIQGSGKGDYLDPDESQVFLGGYIKDEIKRVMRRVPSLKEQISQRDLRSESGSESESKKIFSFHGSGQSKTGHVTSAFAPRCFGYARDEMELKSITVKIKHTLDSKGAKYSFTTGQEVIDAF